MRLTFRVAGLARVQRRSRQLELKLTKEDLREPDEAFPPPREP